MTALHPTPSGREADSSPAPSRVGVVGATGYAGRELADRIESHPALSLAFRMSAREGEPVPTPEFEAEIEALDVARFADLDGLFACTPHGVAVPIVQAALEAGCRVVDLSADFRLKDAALYERTYGQPHGAPELLGEAVYGLTEHAREALAGARLVANPGCYPTSILLPLVPLLEREALDTSAGLVCDSKSGLSGAGKAPSETTHYGRVHDNFRAYGVGTHRHAPEIAQGAGTDAITFVPHLLPTFRGILSTIYVKPAAGLDASALLAMLDEQYADEAFVRVHHEGLPELATVVHTNRCEIGLAPAGERVVIVSVLDNLVKGAAGQALQNMNRMLGLDEGLGLAAPAGLAGCRA